METIPAQSDYPQELTAEEHDRAKRIAFLKCLERGGGRVPPYDRELALGDFWQAAGEVSGQRGAAVIIFHDIRPCSPAEVDAQIKYLRTTPVWPIAERLHQGLCKLSKGVVRSLSVLGSLKSMFSQLRTERVQPTTGVQKFQISEVYSVLRGLPDGGDLLRRIESCLATDEAAIDYNITAILIGSEPIVTDGNARTVAFYERRRGREDEITYPIFIVEER